jgi:hypothetical protein
MSPTQNERILLARRVLLLITVIIIVAVPCFSEPQTKPEKGGEQSVPFQVYDGYFIRNDFPLTDQPVYLAITSQVQFDQIFGTAPMPGRTFLPDNAFDAKLVVATVVQGKFFRKYEVTKITREGRKLSVWYTSNDQPGGSATFGSPLILTVDKNDYEQVIFIKDGKEAAHASVSVRPK